jgi:hypothetical protein
MSVISFAAGATMSFSKSEVKLGDNVTVTVTVSGSNIAGVQFNINYDSSVLTLKSCSDSSGGGKVMWYHENGSVSSHSTTFVFTANKTGRTYISTSGMLVSDSNADKIGGFSDQGAYLTVSSNETTTKAPETTTKKPETTTKAPETTTKKQDSSTTTTKKDESTTESTTTADNTKAVLNGKEYLFVDDSAFVDAPDGFDETYSDYKGNRILTYTSKDKSQQIVCLTDEENNKIFALFNDEKDEFSELIKVKSADLHLIVLTARNDIIPSGFAPTTAKIGDRDITVYQNATFKAENICLVYALGRDGNAAFYVYDNTDGTFQRYRALTPVTSETVTETETTDPSLDGRIPLSKTNMLKAIIALAVVLLASLIAILTLALKLRKRDGRVKIEEEFDINEYTE